MTSPRNNGRPTTTPQPSLPNGTPVLNIQDGEPATIMNGFAWDTANGAWTDYEVETAYGIECWAREDFALMSEIESEE